MQDRSRPKVMPTMGFERTVTLGDLWNIQSSEKAKGTGERISKPGFQDRILVPGRRPLDRPRDARPEQRLSGHLRRRKPQVRSHRRLSRSPGGTERNSPCRRAPAGRIRRLEFDGINYRANIWLNGKKMADASTTFGAFRRFSIDVDRRRQDDGKKRPGRRGLSPRRRASPRSVSSTGTPPLPTTPWASSGRSASGRRVTVSIENPFVVTKLDLETFKEARLTVSAELSNHTDRKVAGTLEGRIESLSFSRDVTLAPGEREKSSSRRRSPPSSSSRTRGSGGPTTSASRSSTIWP